MPDGPAGAGFVRRARRIRRRAGCGAFRANARISYPDGDQAADGLIHVIYDHDRTGAQEILLASFAEADVLAGKNASGRLRLRGVVSAKSVQR